MACIVGKSSFRAIGNFFVLPGTIIGSRTVIFQWAISDDFSTVCKGTFVYHINPASFKINCALIIKNCVFTDCKGGSIDNHRCVFCIAHFSVEYRIPVVLKSSIIGKGSILREG